MQTHTPPPNKSSLLVNVSFAAVLLALSVSSALAGSATWNLNPVDDDWINPNNWTPATVPNGPSDTATFGVSNNSIISLTIDTELAEMVFQPGASGYVIGTAPYGAVLTMSGVGVTNNSGIAQIIATLPTFTGPGGIIFANSASAGSQMTYTNNGVSFGDPPEIDFMDNSRAGSGTFTNSGAFAAGVDGSLIVFAGSSSADRATLINNGATVGGAGGGVTRFTGTSSAGSATLLANAGQGGGEGGRIEFLGRARGGSASVEVFGNGTLSIADSDRTDVALGSIEGDGVISLGEHLLEVGRNSRSTIVSGVIEGTATHGASLWKTGGGTLELTGANTYLGATEVFDGTLLVNNRSGSATGRALLAITGGTLGGSGSVANAVIVGTAQGSGSGARLAPGVGARTPKTLHAAGSITFYYDSRLACKFYPDTARSDAVVANGITISIGATFAFLGGTGVTIPPGTVFTLIKNAGSTNAIDGNFGNLPDGGTVTSNGNKFLVDYQGGDGNDLTLTVVP